MICHVRDPDDLGKTGPQQGLDALTHGDCGEAAALTTTLEAKAHAACVQALQHNATTVSCDRRSDVLVQYLAHPVGKLAVLIHLRPTGLHSRHADAGYFRERRAQE